MRLRNKNRSMSLVTINYSLVGSLQGTTPLVPGTVIIPGVAFNSYALPTVNSNVFTTILSVSRRVEDVGNIELISIGFFCDVTYTGNGSLKWEISGDGGITWVPFAQGNFNVGIPTPDSFLGAGLWITNIQPGDNKLQVRLQALANAGNVDVIIVDDTVLNISYRKKILF